MVGLALGVGACRDPDPGPSTSGSTTTTTSADSSDETSEGSSGSTSTTGVVTSGSAQSLVTPDAWLPAAADQDPLVDERPADVQCALGFGEEVGAFEVDTELCLYGAFAQPSLAPVQAGDTIELVLLHDDLYAVDPATAHLAIALGDDVVWQTEIPIPSEAALVRPSWTAAADVPVGTPVHFHVHNHGVNNYRLIDLTVAPPM